ncbi:MAG: hypothetical protein M1490_01125 [Candidatus Bathyarchaeota archaeon]|nr:hypothetical protein [Candidatus Bathyarchaeota archaeon]
MGLEEERLDAIRTIILEHKGKNNPIRASKISHMLNIPENDTVPTTRKLITKLILNEEMPIAASGEGYFYIENQKELADYMEYLDERIRQTTNRKVKVFSNFQGKYGKAKLSRLDDF